MNIGSLQSQAWDIIGNINWGSAGVPTEQADLIAVIGTVITAAYSIAGIAAVAFIIYGGYSVMIATGDPQKLKKGQDTLAFAAVGLVVVLVSGVILNYIADLLGVSSSLFNFNLPYI